MMTRITIAITLFAASATCLFAQQTIQIRVVDSKHLRPVTDECLNISLGKWHGAELFLPTDSAGQITLIIQDNKVEAPLVPAKACNANSITGPVLFDSSTQELAIVTDEYVICQYSKDVVKNPAWINATPAQRIPAYSVQEISRHGIAATNGCSKLSPMAKPGELVLVVRKRTLWEGMKS